MKKPHVAIDLCASASGGAITYLRNLLPLLRQGGTFDYSLILRDSQRRALGATVEGYGHLLAPEFTVRPVPRLAWGQLALPAQLWRRRVDLLFAPTDHPPVLLPCPLVMAVRNPTPYTDLATLAERGRRTRERVMRALTRAATRRAERVIFVSRAAAEAINARLRVPAEKVRIVHHGLDPVIARGVDGPAADGVPADLPSDFVLAVSSFYLYKNYLGLVRALALLRDRHGVTAPLVICGREIESGNVAAVRAEVRERGLPVRFLGEVGPEALAVLYRRARIFVFPSFLETFGHPLVEAMASGAPVAAGNIPTSRELCGEAARYFDPHSPEEMCAVIHELWRDERARRALAEAGRERSRAFSWVRTAEETEAVLLEALR